MRRFVPHPVGLPFFLALALLSCSGRTIRSCWCSRICGSRWSMCLAADRRTTCSWCWLHGTWRGSEKFSAGTLALFAKKAYFCNPFARQGRSSVGSERLSHIQEVIGSTPIVPTRTSGRHAGGPYFMSSRRLFVTTSTELQAIAAAATIGFRTKPRAPDSTPVATGMAIRL